MILFLVVISAFVLAQLLGILSSRATTVVIRDKGAIAVALSTVCGGELTRIDTWCEVYNSGGEGWVKVEAFVGCGPEWSKSKRVHVGRKRSTRVDFRFCVPCDSQDYDYSFDTEVEEVD